MEETMNEIVDNADEDSIEQKAAEIVADKIVIDTQDVMEHLGIEVGDIAQEIDLYDLAYQLDKDDIARELCLSDVADELDLEDLASYVAGRMANYVDMDYKEVASNLSMDEIACEIDVGMIAEQIVVNVDTFSTAIQKAMASHDQDITHMFQVLADALNNVAEERRGAEE